MVDRCFHIQSQWDIIIWTFSPIRSTSMTFAPVVHKRHAKMNVSHNEVRCRITIKVKSQLFAASRWREIKKKGTKLFGQIKGNKRRSKLRANFDSRLEGEKNYSFYISLT